MSDRNITVKQLLCNTERQRGGSRAVSSGYDGNNDTTACGQRGTSEEEHHPQTRDRDEDVVYESDWQSKEAGKHSKHRAEFQCHDTLPVILKTHDLKKSISLTAKHTWVL